jgi:Fur family ferric uptake transcriptional regulator
MESRPTRRNTPAKPAPAPDRSVPARDNKPVPARDSKSVPARDNQSVPARDNKSVPDRGGAKAEPEAPRPREAAEDRHVEQAREDIRAAGFRATPARIATLIELRASDSPLTHADLAERLSASGVDKATAFRNLNDLAQRGLLRRTELGDHVWRFEAINLQDNHDRRHPHFVCVDCGHVTCLNDVQLKVDNRKRGGKAVGEVTEILLRGHCTDCQ